MKRRGRPRKKPRSLHLSVSATDGEWEIVQRNADRRRKSVARYVVDLVLGEDSGPGDMGGEPVALDRGEQREVLDILRRLSRHVGDEGNPSLIADLQARVAVLFDIVARDMVAGGRAGELRDSLVRVVGDEERADAVIASLGPVVQRPEPEAGPEQREEPKPAGRRKPPEQDSLF